jgi:Protein of unknown function (DUF2442)
MGRVSKEKGPMKAYHDIKNLHFSGEYMLLAIDGEEKKFRIKEISSALEKASDSERNTYEISPSGYGIHWPLIDEDISVDGLLGIAHTREPKRKTA